MSADIPEYRNKESYKGALIDYIIGNNPSKYTSDTLPSDQSLIELEILDSFGFVSLIVYIEETWNIQIDDSDFTMDKMGSIDKIVDLVDQYVSKNGQKNSLLSMEN